MDIRKAREEDAAKIARVHVESWQETYKGLIDQDYLDSLKIDNRERMWKETLANRQKEQPVFIAEIENGIIGFSSFGKERTNKFNKRELLMELALLLKNLHMKEY